MFNVRLLNIAIELWGVAFCAIGIVCVLLLTQKGWSNRNIILAGFVFEIVACAGDALAGMFRGQEGMLAGMLVRCGNWTTFAGNFLLVAVLTSYLVNRIAERGGPAYRTWRTCVYGATLVMILLMSVGAFFSIDETNVYHRNSLYWIGMAFVVTSLATDAALAIRNQRTLGKTSLSFLLFYTLVPLVAAAAQVVVYGLNFVIVAGVLSLVVLFFEMQTNSAAHMLQQTRELAQSHMELNESRIQVMVSQIQPHFLFNTLDTIYGLVDEDADAAKQAIASFSRYLRANLDSLRRTTPVPVETELEHVRTYLELERASDPGKVSYEIDTQATGFLVPALAVQTLVENAAKHGIGQNEAGGKIEVRTREDDTGYTVAICDNGVGFDGSKASEGVGISNTRSRLAAMCNGTLDIQSTPGVGTTATIRIPKQAEEQTEEVRP